MQSWEEPLLARMCEEHRIPLQLVQELLISQDKASMRLITKQEHLENIKRLIVEEAAAS